jgi:endonuclease/exonuclease/phosphatase (EEP) superfamily protein YafD
MRRPSSRLLKGVCWSTLSFLLLLAAARLIAHDASQPLMLLNVFTPYYLPLAALLLLLAAWRRMRALALGSLALVLLLGAWLLPGTVRTAPRPPSTAPRLRLMSANLLMVNRDTAGITGEIRAARPDVLFVQELTPDWLRALSQPELQALLPHRLVEPHPPTDSFGIGILSRLPLADAALQDLDGVPLATATVELAGTPVRLYNVHTLPPRTAEYYPIWRQQLTRLAALLDSESGAVILGGDLNVTQHAAWYRQLVRGSVRGAHEQCGRGLATTWPNGRFPVPSIRLDHLFLSLDLVCVSMTEGEGRGSDHRPLLLELARVGP